MSSTAFFFSGWTPVVRILVVGVSMYAALVLFLRLSGSRTLATMNIFDFIVTVALGSAFGRALTASGVALVEALVAFALLIALQYAVAWGKTRSDAFGRIITNRPSLLYFRDEFLRDEMRDERVTEDELRAAARKQNVGSLEEAEAIVLESSGQISVIKESSDGSALASLPTDRTDHLLDDE